MYFYKGGTERIAELMMTGKKALELGYSLVAASWCEVGLLKNGKGIKTWWVSAFDGWPGMNHPKILDAVIENERTQSYQVAGH